MEVGLGRELEHQVEALGRLEPFVEAADLGQQVAARDQHGQVDVLVGEQLVAVALERPVVDAVGALEPQRGVRHLPAVVGLEVAEQGAEEVGVPHVPGVGEGDVATAGLVERCVPGPAGTAAWDRHRHDPGLEGGDARQHGLRVVGGPVVDDDQSQPSNVWACTASTAQWSRCASS